MSIKLLIDNDSRSKRWINYPSSKPVLHRYSDDDVFLSISLSTIDYCGVATVVYIFCYWDFGCVFLCEVSVR